MAAKHLVLLGDSVFDNQTYVEPDEAVIDQTQRLIGSDALVTLLAVDGDVAVRVNDQLKRLPDSATHLALSVGGNDALGCLPALDQSCNSIMEALSKLSEIQAAFETQYRNALQGVSRLGLPTIVCTIYDAVPGLPPPLRTALSLFNDVITREALKAGMEILDLRIVMNDMADYSDVSPIEPSGAGGRKIAESLQRWIQGH